MVRRGQRIVVGDHGRGSMGQRDGAAVAQNPFGTAAFGADVREALRVDAIEGVVDKVPEGADGGDVVGADFQQRHMRLGDS